MYRTSWETNLNILRITCFLFPAPSSPASLPTIATIAAFVFARCGAQRSQYHFEISGQLSDVETRMFCTCVYMGGISGSAKACAEFVAVKVWTSEPSASFVTLVMMLPRG